MKTRFVFLFLTIAVCIFSSADSKSEAIKPRQYTSDGRFKAWTYYPNTVYHFVGHYMNHTYIEFDEGETVSTISTPKPTAWHLVPTGNRLFIKPVEDDANTTMTVMTNMRTYFFELHAAESKGPFDKDLNFFIKFRYQKPQDGATDEDGSVIQYSSTSLPDLSHPERYNFNYTMSGDEIISPIKVFDDGKFTYMQFDDNNGIVPAIFIVDNEGFEEIANFRVVGDYMVVERLSAVFSLRNGSATVCIFNENKKTRK